MLKTAEKVKAFPGLFTGWTTKLMDRSLMGDPPRITVVIPTLNNEKDIQACLVSIFEQQYPKDLMDVIIVDGGSTDNTLRIAHGFPVRICVDKSADSPEKAKMVGYRLSTGEVFTFLDADMRLPSRDWLLKMTYPLCKDEEIVATFTRYFVNRSDPSLNRCLSYSPSQCDPLLSFLYPRSGSVFRFQSGSYIKFDFKGNVFPPIGFLLYRTASLREVLDDSPVLMDVDLPNKLIQKGRTKFAYVPSAGLFHLHASNLRQLLRKRIRNIDNMHGDGFLPRFEQRNFLWINPGRPMDIARLLLWIIYSNLMLPHTIVALYKTVKFRDLACMWESILAPIVTDAILVTVIRNPKGRKLLWKVVLDLQRH